MLEARGVKKSYRSGDGRIQVLEDVSLAIDLGESVSIRGESGSGKSTLLNLLAGLDAPDAGELWWSGEKITPDNATERRARYLGIVFQSFYLIPEMDARANVLMARRIAGKVDAAARRRADDLLARVGLSARAGHLPAQLSGGERQRVAVARALMNAPSVILADEPTGNLDEKTGESVIELLLTLCTEMRTALVLVTHNPVHAARTSRHFSLHNGRLETAS